MVDPTNIVAEILGEPASSMRNPVNAGYECPFINSTCIKRSQKLSGPYPVCSIFVGKKPAQIAVCPKRLFEANLVQDVLDHAWVGTKPEIFRVAHEVKMAGFGNVDMVIAEISKQTGKVANFISVELQSVDTTGSFEPAYSALVNSTNLELRPSYNVNWKNVKKRYFAQLINKGFFHHHWEAKMVSVIQDPLYEYFRKESKFSEFDPKSETANIVFMTYDFEDDGSGSGSKRLVLKRAVGTSHEAVMMSVLYQKAPSREKFCERILSRIIP